MLINPLAKSGSTADAGDQSPGSGQVHHTGRLSMAWKRSGFESLSFIFAQHEELLPLPFKIIFRQDSVTR
jgi:hypothetical protein